MHIKGKAFPIILGASALFVEVCAAFFSVYGLSKLFAGATTAVIIMASSLEIAKVIAASYLYRHWKTTHILQKIYMVGAICVLVTITSMGIYGFLSNAFQASTLDLEKQTTQLTLYEQEVSRLTEDKKDIQIEKEGLLKSRDAELGKFSVVDTARKYLDDRASRRIRKDYEPVIANVDKKLEVVGSKLTDLHSKIFDTKNAMVETGADVGPVIFVARFFETDISTVVQYLIFVFIFVFDPLAVVLIIATNKAWLEATATVTPELTVATTIPELTVVSTIPVEVAPPPQQNQITTVEPDEPNKFIKNDMNKQGVTGMAPTLDVSSTPPSIG
jgi:hypothetical protein